MQIRIRDIIYDDQKETIAICFSEKDIVRLKIMIEKEEYTFCFSVHGTTDLEREKLLFLKDH